MFSIKDIKKLIYLSIIVIIIISLSLLKKKFHKTKDTNKYLRVIICPDNKPFNYIDKDGKFVGSEIDLVKKIAKKMNKKVKLIAVEFPNAIASLNVDVGDIIIAALTSTESRKKSVLFSTPYHTGSVVLVCKNQDINIDKQEKYKIGVQFGSTISSVAKKEFTNSEMIEVPAIPAMFEMLKCGAVDFILIDELSVNKIDKNKYKVQILEGFNSTEYCIAMKSKELQGAINKALNEIFMRI